VSTTLPAKEMPINQSALPSGRVMTKPPPMKMARSGPMVDRIFGWLAKGAALFTLAMLIAILVSLTISAWPAISKYGLGFLTSTSWDPVKEEFGGLVMIYGTLMTSLICALSSNAATRGATLLP